MSNFVVCLRDFLLCNELLTVSEANRSTHDITTYGGSSVFEYWAEAVTDWVFGATSPDGYKVGHLGRQSILGTPMEDLIEKVFGGSP